MRQWRLIYDSPTPGVLNMSVDEAILRCKPLIPTLRFYAWEPGCLSLGYGQRIADVDCERLHSSGYDLVRRPTGGRAILHRHELTYSLILPQNHPIAAGGVLPSYQRISRALQSGLALMGIGTEAAKQTQRRTASGPVCFEKPSHYEMVVKGRKLIGSAQLRRQAGFLQHGSLPLGGDIAAICDVLAYADDTSREQARNQVRKRAITLTEARDGETATWQAAAEAIAQGFQAAFDIEFHIATLTSNERRAAGELAETVYGNPQWTARR